MKAALFLVPILILGGAPATVKLIVPAGLEKTDAKTSVDDEHYLGYFTVVARTSAEAERGIERSSITWDLTGRRQKLADKKEVVFSLVPLTQGPTDDRPIFSRAYLAKN